MEYAVGPSGFGQRKRADAGICHLTSDGWRPLKMDFTYEFIAAAIVALPFFLTWLLSAKSGDAVKVLGSGLGTKETRARKSGALPALVTQLLYERRKTQAVALVRQRTGATEAAALEMVEAIEKAGKAAKA